MFDHLDICKIFFILLIHYSDIWLNLESDQNVKMVTILKEDKNIRTELLSLYLYF